MGSRVPAPTTLSPDPVDNPSSPVDNHPPPPPPPAHFALSTYRNRLLTVPARAARPLICMSRWRCSGPVIPIGAQSKVRRGGCWGWGDITVRDGVGGV